MKCSRVFALKMQAARRLQEREILLQSLAASFPAREAPMIDYRRLLQSVVGLAVILLVNHFIFGQKISNLQIVLTYVLIHVIIVLGMVFRRRQSRVMDGWHYLTPGPMEWFALILGAGLSLLLLYVYHFVGSARADAAFQMQVLKWLIVVFSSVTALVGFYSFVMSTRWNDERIERVMPFRSPHTILLRNVVTVRHKAWSDCLLIEDAAGKSLRVSVYQNGAASLVRKLTRENEPVASS